MREPTEIENRQYQRLQNLFAIARKRYLDAGGNPNLSGGSLNKQDYLTEAEKQEIRELGQQVFSRSNSSVKT